MASLTPAFANSNPMHVLPIQQSLESAIDQLINSLPDPEHLTSQQRRGIIARYSAVLEGNFIYWMTAALLSVKSEDSRSIVVANLLEEVRDCHPDMLRRFALAADAAPTHIDFLAIYQEVTRVRLFLGSLNGVQIVLTMGFFEGFIQKFMGYLADLARRQGSGDMEYTDVHGVCDITHTQELLRAVTAEMLLDPPKPETDLLEGVDLLSALITKIIHFDSVQLLVAQSASPN